MQERLKGTVAWFDRQIGKLGIPDDETLLMSDEYDREPPQPIHDMPGIQLLDFDANTDMPFGFGKSVLDHLVAKREQGLMPMLDRHRLVLLDLTFEDALLISMLRKILETRHDFADLYGEFLTAIYGQVTHEIDRALVVNMLVGTDGKLDENIVEVIKRDDPDELRKVVRSHKLWYGKGHEIPSIDEVADR